MHKNLRRRARRGQAALYFDRVVRSYSSDACLFWPFGKNGTGYGWMSYGGRRTYVHRIACEIVHGHPPTPKHQAAHSCGKGHLGCVNPRHVSWKVRSENEKDKLLHGTSNRGERHGNAKLTADQVINIRNAKNPMAVGRRLGISPAHVDKLCRRTRWTWLA